MDVRLSPEQVALRDSVARVVAQLGPATVAALDDGERAAKLDAAVDAAGWRELRTADDGGAPWASGVEVAIVAEQLARGVADTAFVGPTLAAELRRLAGAPAATTRETVALTPDLAALATGSGGAVAVDAAGAATALLRGAPPPASGTRIPLLSVGFQVPEREGGRGLDLTRPSARVDGAAAQPVGELTADDVVRWTAPGLATTCGDLVGAMQGVVDLTVAYAKDRRQYGAPIGSFQAVQHLLADAHVATEGSRSITLHAAWAVDALEPGDALAAAASAKAYCARAARTVGETAIQVHGGVGNTWECMAHVFLRRALLSIDVLGGVGPNLERVLGHHGLR